MNNRNAAGSLPRRSRLFLPSSQAQVQVEKHHRPMLPRLANATSSIVVGLLLITASGVRADVDTEEAFAVIRRVDNEGTGNDVARDAWAKISALPANHLPRLLEAMNGANARACNYFLAAASAIADREEKAGRPLPIAALGDFLLNRTHDPRARRLAFELIARANARTAEILLSGLLDDPAQELRRDAVQRIIDAAANASTGGDKDSAKLLYTQALQFSRDAGQISSIMGPLKDLGRSVDLVSLLGFVTQWKVIGAFDNTGRTGFEKVFPPEQEIDWTAEYDGKSGKVRWQEFTSTHEFGMVDFNKPLGALKEVTGYAWTEFQSSTERPAELRLGCKNGWKLWFNRKYVFGRDEYHRGAEIDQYRLPVTITPGRNTILVKLTQNEQKEDWTVEWEFQLRITDPNGQIIRTSTVEKPVALR